MNSVDLMNMKYLYILILFFSVNFASFSEILNFKRLTIIPKNESSIEIKNETPKTISELNPPTGKVEKKIDSPQMIPIINKPMVSIEKKTQRVDSSTPFLLPFTKKLLVLAEYSPDPENPHKGILYSPIEIGNVISSMEGKVVVVDYMDGYHNYIILEHSSGYYTVYANLQEVLVAEGQTIQKGEILGTLLKEKGLYFQITQGKKTIDPNLFVKN